MYFCHPIKYRMDRSKGTFQENLRRNFGFEPTASQAEAMERIADFIYGKGDNFLFQLSGYAGTGKTSLVSALVKTLADIGVQIVMLAPTGRAAKVLSQYSGRKAYTIHKWIYRVYSKEGVRKFVRRENKDSHTLFIVDEASMIADGVSESSLFGNNSLMDDLFSYVFEGSGCQLLLVGDGAQLPPVNFEESPALSIDYIQRNFSLLAGHATLTDVTRQNIESGILRNASQLRQRMEDEDFSFPILPAPKFSDCKRINGEELEELFNDLYGRYSPEEIVTITYSNKRAYIYNQEIRHRILYKEDELSAGDLVIAVKNNYFWIKDDAEVGFIANGDSLEILSINKIQELYGFRFADVTVRLCDYPNHGDIDIKIILESLTCEGASLGKAEMDSLYYAVSEDYADIPTKRERYAKMKEDPFLNAVQVKFSYALTCHKTQGGQWPVVLLDPGLIRDGVITKSYLRWLYTALTRATSQVYLLNFADDFFEK